MSPPDPSPVPLDTVITGEKARIASVRAKGQLRKRLLEMGIIPGAIIESIRVAPLGDPVEFRIKGYSLSIRKKDASCIDVVMEVE
ncbi:ferrous iron transport protein A [Methanocalculus alkaliphilus]|uniref:FeoA family protein n=1 Tax=Methanocalculus alkaliphilus TaxID=768730 RepID=UPI0020A23253|nr:ferrous iron transport protein A [Methanocalculus alkaliphilus]MCP1715452.1 ferrous iron transport protein A [Methanocalculus alkaliphilus]